MKLTLPLVTGICVGLLSATSALAGTKTTAGSGLWTNGTTWVGGFAPSTGDDATIASGHSVTVDVSVASLASLTNSGTLTFVGWPNTVVTATVVHVSGTITHLAQSDTNSADGWTPDNRIWLVCSNLVITASGSIDADGKGYAGGDDTTHLNGYGPGAGLSYRGGGHGGYGGADSGAHGATYGSVTAPTEPGSGGGGYASGLPNVGGAGGGAVRIDVAGHAIVNGTISADGDPGSGSANVWGGGSGGSIYLSCGTLAGTDGLISAGGGGSSASYARSGGGGRVAVIVTNTTAQAVLPPPTVGFSANRGNTGTPATHMGDIGTLYVPLERLFPNLLGPGYNGRLKGFTQWTRDTLTVSNGWLGTLESGSQMTVSNDLRVLGSDGRLDLSNATVTVGGSVFLDAGSLYLYGGGTNGSSLSCATNLALTNGALFQVQAGVTNDTTTNYGSRVSVPGVVSVAANCTVIPYSHTTNGGSVLFSVGDLYIAANGRMDSDEAGFSGAMAANSPGFGPGRGRDKYCGAGYGGGGAGVSGANNGLTYGSSNAPAHPGSGGGSYTSVGGRGGGLVRVEAAGTITVDGTISADGEDPLAGAGAGSGGGIHLICDTFDGAAGGTLRADGGDTWRTGGGGRIAVWRFSDLSAGAVSTSVANGTGGTGESPTSTVGTVVWGTRQAANIVSLIVASDSVEVGDPSPHDYGTYALTQNSALTESVTTPAEQTSDARYVCVGWRMTNELGGSASDTNSEASFVLATNATLTWRWAQQYHLTTTAGANGSLAVDQTGWHMSTSLVSITAVPAGGYHFLQWSGVPPGMISSNPLTVAMDQPRAIKANFANDTPTTREWNGVGNWFSATNWSSPLGAGVPGTGDTVVIRSGTSTLGEPVAVADAVVSNGATLCFSNWTASLTASSIEILSGGTVTQAPGTVNGSTLTSNRVHMACASFVLNDGGVIDVDGAGYLGGDTGPHMAGYGPGAGPSYRGGGHGGVGGGGGGVTYGSTNAPTAPGSGGGGYNSPASDGGAGGGAVRIDVSGHAVVNGTISADGVKGTGASSVFSGGSGGSIYLTCNTFAGTGGVMRANGGGDAAQAYMRTGGGGRIAVVASDTVAQNALPTPSVSFSAGREETGSSSPSYRGDIGTVYLLYERWLPATLTPAYNGRFGGFSSWTRDSLTISNGWIGTLEEGWQMTVTNDLRVLGNDGRLDVSNATVTVGGSVFLDAGSLYLYGGGTSGSSLSCGTALTLTNGALFQVQAGVTNDVATNSGAQVSVPVRMVVGASCSVIPYSHPTNGGSVLFSVGDLLVAAGGEIDADEAGFSGAMTPNSPGFGPGRGRAAYCGAGYGGIGAGSGGAGNGLTYGNSNAPVHPGSGGGSYLDHGGRGGGLVRVEATGTITVNGTISADGQDPPAGAGAGSGGGIYLTCRTFAGAAGGVLQANGGDTWRTGGGGRVAVWRFNDTAAGAVAAYVNPGTGGQNESPASGVGTIVWGMASAGGTLIIVR